MQIGARLVLLLAISLAGVLVGLGSSRTVSLGSLSVDVSSTRILLLVAGVIGVWTGISAFRQMDDKHGVPILADLWGSIRGRPLSPAEAFVRQRHLRGLRGRRGRGQIDPGHPARRRRCARRDTTWSSPASRARPTWAPGSAAWCSTNGADADAPSPRAEALLYAADRAHHVATVVRPALARGAVVISDRYVDSSLAYQGAGRTLPVQEISWLSSWATGGLKPDLVVLLDVDPTVGLGRVDTRGLGTDRLESESPAFHERVRYAFLDLASADPKRYLVLDAARPVDEIADAVAARINALLSAGDDSHPEPASTAVPPGPDLNAPDLADTTVVPPHADPNETMVVRDPNATMVVRDPNATMVVRAGG